MAVPNIPFSETELTANLFFIPFFYCNVAMGETMPSSQLPAHNAKAKHRIIECCTVVGDSTITSH